MDDLDTLIRELKGPPPPPVRLPRKTRWIPISAALLAAAGILVWAWPEPQVGRRGQEGPDTDYDLRAVIDRDGQSVRVSPGALYQVGEVLYFRVAADRTGPAALWVEGPEGQVQVARPDLSPSPTDVRDAGGLVGWRFERPGRYSFYLSSEVGDCPVGACARLDLEVR